MINHLIDIMEGSPSQGIKKNVADELAPSWDLDKVLFDFTGQGDVFLLGDACEGVSIIGTSGSGKTSGSGRTIALQYLLNGFGGLVLCAKTDEPARWREYARLAGRENDLIEFGSAKGEVFPMFNFLDHELQRVGDGAGETENIINLFVAIAELAERKNGRSANADFWQRAMKVMLRNAVELLILARGRVSLLEINEVISFAPQNRAEAGSDDWRGSSPTYAYLQDAEIKSKGDEDSEYEFQMVSKYWLQEFPGIPDKTRAGFVEVFRGLADGFLRGKLRKLFCSKTNVSPELLTQGAIIIINLPVKVHDEIGQFANALWYYCTMRTLEQRPDADSPYARPVFIWADEAQLFVMKQSQSFQGTARSIRGCTVLMSQSISEYYAALGSDSKDAVDSLLGNLKTKIFHCSGNGTSNDWAANTIGKIRKTTTSYSSSTNSDSCSGGEQRTDSVAQIVDYDCMPREFTLLRTGRAENNFYVDGIVHRVGRLFSNGKTWIKTSFHQRK